MSECPPSCPRCGSLAFWDNHLRKRSGQWKLTAPDYTCKRCHFKVWPEALPPRVIPPAVETEPVRHNSASPFFS